MKVLHVNSMDIHGGAARAVYRLHQALLDYGVESQMLVGLKESDDTSVYTIYGNDRFTQNKINDRKPILFYTKKESSLFSPSYIKSDEVLQEINSSDADIIHLHWIAYGFLRIEDIEKINKPIMWTLHDTWGFTGGCHVMGDCEKYKYECSACPRLSSDDIYDISYGVFTRKLLTYRKLPFLTINGVSSWLADCVRESYLLKDKYVINLPNVIDAGYFTSSIKGESRNELNLASNKKIILFGAISSNLNLNKGFNELLAAIKVLDSRDIEFVVFGNKDVESVDYCGVKTYYLGHLNDNQLMHAYSAADVMIVPSLQEPFGQTATEAMSCNTPVVAFGCAGLLDIVDHKVNGYLAKPFDIEDLARGIDWVLNTPQYEDLCINARKKVLAFFDKSVVTDNYLKEYKRTIASWSSEKTELYPEYALLGGEYLDKKLVNSILDATSDTVPFIIYGNGTIGKLIYEVCPEKIIGHVDIMEPDNHPSKLKQLKFDKIIISVLGREESIIQYLTVELGIDPQKIMTIGRL